MKKLFTHIRPDIAPVHARQATRTILPVSFILLSISSTQVGAALAKSLFTELGPVGTVGLRVGWAALILLILWRSQLRHIYGWKAYRLAGLFGITLAAMNLSFYTALSELPLGVAATLEFLGPLTLAVVQSRKVLDVLWVLFAACGLLLLAPIHGLGGTTLSLPGIGLALLAGVCWAAYILLTARVGGVFPGGVGLALATVVAAMLLVPLSILQAGKSLLDPALLLVGAGVGLLSSALPYSLEMEALRYLPSRVFSVLLSLEPVIAALIGFVVLREQLTWQAMVAIALISVSSIGVVFFQQETR
jgi:inner membrane transporter RhtA